MDNKKEQQERPIGVVVDAAAAADAAATTSDSNNNDTINKQPTVAASENDALLSKRNSISIISSSSIENIENVRTSMQQLHDSGNNFTYAWRLLQLQTLRRMVLEHWEEYINALYIDLHKCSTESIATELLMIRTELDVTISQLKRWMKPQPPRQHQNVPSPMVCFPAFTELQCRPLLGPAVLILGPFNYPLSLVLHPTIGALAAGNPVVLKPSELTPTVANLLSSLVTKYFTPDVMVCITGGIPETTKLLSYPWGRIFFTGSTRVGTIVAQAAATTMTPVTLECGGKSICYIDGTTTSLINDTKLLQQITQRIVWSKTLNAGQTCAATDTVICDNPNLVPALIPHFIHNITTMFGTNPKTDSEMGRIVTVQHTQRLIDMIREVEDYIVASLSSSTTLTTTTYPCQIVCGGSDQCSAIERYIVPTIILNPPHHLRIMREEIFGPILPIITVSSQNDAIRYIRQMNDSNGSSLGRTMTPLCLYVFTNSHTVLQQMIRQIPAGSVVRNDCLIHLASPYIPFGGMGTSGYGGTYHGKYTFDLFTHILPVMYRPYVWPRFLPDWNVLRCHPFTPMKQFITIHIAMRLPAIPVLHVRLVSMAVILILAIFLGLWFGTDTLRS